MYPEEYEDSQNDFDAEHQIINIDELEQSQDGSEQFDKSTEQYYRRGMEGVRRGVYAPGAAQGTVNLPPNTKDLDLKTLKAVKMASKVCPVERNPKLKFLIALKDIIRVDDIRLVEVIELAYFAMFFAMFGLFIGTTINRVFTVKTLEDPAIVVFIEAIIQVCLIAIGIFYIKKLVALIPTPFWWIKNYCPYVFTETLSIVILGIVMVATQSRLMNKFEILARRFGTPGKLAFSDREIN